MIIKEIIKWNTAFVVLYIISATSIYTITHDPPETIPVIILTGLIFHGIITIWILHKHLHKTAQKIPKKQDGGEEKNEKDEQGSADEIAANPELPDTSDDAGDIY